MPINMLAAVWCCVLVGVSNLLAVSATRLSGNVNRFNDVKFEKAHVLTDSNRQGDPPASVDWRKKGVVTPVRQQGEQGLSALFAFLDGLESFYAIQNHNTLKLASEQELMDCCGSRTGEILDDVYTCVLNMSGLCAKGDYKPEEGRCRNSTCKPVFTFKHELHVLRGSERALEAAVVTQPIIVAIDASHLSFMDYKSGVLVDPACSQTQVDHAMLLVGYGQTNDGVKYWILKNSWGKVMLGGVW